MAYDYVVKDVDWARQFLADLQTGGDVSDPEGAKESAKVLTVEGAAELVKG